MVMHRKLVILLRTQGVSCCTRLTLLDFAPRGTPTRTPKVIVSPLVVEPPVE